ncbi:MAG: radical SAM protein [Candidatus Heimdallarchaeota archaeon]
MQKDLENCKLCAWECGVDRQAGEYGVCLQGLPEIASCQLHPAPPQSYTVFLAACNFKCLNCQNWEIAHYPVTNAPIRGQVNPEIIAQEGVSAIHSITGRLIHADRFFFSGGSPTVSLPWIEEVISHGRSLDSTIKVNFDTNGFPSKESFCRILAFSDSITFDLKAISDDIHRALTGAPVEPVLKNAETMARYARKLWEFRILVIPSIVDVEEIQLICEFIASLDETLPVCFLAFRPNYCLDSHPGAPQKLMEQCLAIAQKNDLENSHWAGQTGLKRRGIANSHGYHQKDAKGGAKTAMHYASRAGCMMDLRSCGQCISKLECQLKAHVPSKTL